MRGMNRDHRSLGIRTYLQIYLSRFDRVGKLKGQTMYARYSVRTRRAAANLMISSYSRPVPTFVKEIGGRENLIFGVGYVKGGNYDIPSTRHIVHLGRFFRLL